MIKVKILVLVLKIIIDYLLLNYYMLINYYNDIKLYILQ